MGVRNRTDAFEIPTASGADDIELAPFCSARLCHKIMPREEASGIIPYTAVLVGHDRIVAFWRACPLLTTSSHTSNRKISDSYYISTQQPSSPKVSLTLRHALGEFYLLPSTSGCKSVTPTPTIQRHYSNIPLFGIFQRP